MFEVKRKYKGVLMMVSAYEKNVKNLKKIDASEIESLSDDAFIYFGRKTCRFCREFSEEFKTAGVLIYYVDTTGTNVDENLQKVREMYDVKTVPTFIYRYTDNSYLKLNRDVRQSIAHFISSIN